MNQKLVMPEGNGSAQSSSFAVEDGSMATIVAHGTIGSDTGQLQIDYSGGGDWVDALSDDSTTTLSATTTTITVQGPGLYRINATARVGSWGVSVSRSD